MRIVAVVALTSMLLTGCSASPEASSQVTDTQSAASVDPITDDCNRLEQVASDWSGRLERLQQKRASDLAELNRREEAGEDVLASRVTLRDPEVEAYEFLRDSLARLWPTLSDPTLQRLVEAWSKEQDQVANWGAISGICGFA
jgi:outer membrane murein-binding lipoprotein Lpp